MADKIYVNKCGWVTKYVDDNMKIKENNFLLEFAKVEEKINMKRMSKSIRKSLNDDDDNANNNHNNDTASQQR